MNHRKTLAATFFVPVGIGLVGFYSLMQRPRFAAFHTVDVLQLLASGMCFGVALAALLGFFRRGPNA